MHRFEALFNHASMGIVVADSNGVIEAVNPFALKLFDYTLQELTGKKVETLIPGRYHHKHVHNRENYIHHPKNRPMGVGMDLYAVKKDGTEFPVEVSLGNYMDGDKHNAIAFISDISVRKKAEAEIVKLNNELEQTIEQRTSDLKETLRQLELSRDKLEDVLSYQKALFDNAGVMIIATDENGLIKMFNPESASNIGYEESEVLNSKSILLFLDPMDIDSKRKELRETFEVNIGDDFAVLIENSRRNIHEEKEYVFIRKDGTTFPASVTITAIRDSLGKITGFMGIAIDISERKRAEQELRTSLEKARELSELKSRFVSMASHEFRTPLSTVLSSTYLIEKYTSGEDQPKRGKHTQRIISSVNHLTDILNDFLSVGKIEEGKIQVRHVHFDISVLIAEIADEMKNSLRNGQKIVYEHAGQEDVFTDPSMLKHIVMNLVSNAGKFSPENSVIEVKSYHDNGNIIVSVKDQGIGISPEDQVHLMERFFRGANAGNIQGTGLGLHIVARYAELMNGKVACYSELDKGTEFVVTFNTNAN
ncbi:MAG: PAS domain S-box protein [Bacteroidota bacterium]